ncbi:Uncharacterised protein [Mycobacterium tuberculosis]|uniref:Uncharacterized protein n=1 Tax=Mycobacterium tuberculosis TaxID=1773 RepID=A0A655ABJ4_MYCTX|nr:Uncharacterised protein [Mycobacterium tuberculosis]
MGPTELPCGPWPRDRRRGDRRGLGGDQVPAGRPRWGWLFRGLVPRVQQLHARHRTVLQAGRKLHLQLDRQRRPANPGRLQRSDRRRRKLRVAHTRRAAPGCGGAAVVRGHHAVLATAPLECRGEHAGGDHRPRRTGSHGRQAGRRDGRRRDGAVPIAEENGGRSALGGQELLRDRRPGHLPQAARRLRPDPEHRLG